MIVFKKYYQALDFSIEIGISNNICIYFEIILKVELLCNGVVCIGIMSRSEISIYPNTYLHIAVEPEIFIVNAASSKNLRNSE